MTKSNCLIPLVRHADQIVVLEEGRVVEIGKHDQLIGAGGRYRQLAAIGLDFFQVLGVAAFARLDGIRTNDQYVAKPDKELFRMNLLPNLRDRAGYGLRKCFRPR